jgi:hypothetical protein
MSQRNNSKVEPFRLLTLKDAAAYCGICPTIFKRELTIRPINIGATTQILRYDRYDLDDLIDKIKTGISGDHATDWLERLGR